MVARGVALSDGGRRHSQSRRKGEATVTTALSSYDIALHLSPATGELRANVNLDELFSADASELSFLLHRSLRAVTVTGDDVLGVSWDESKPAWVFAPESALLTVKFGHPVTAGERRRLTFVYSGRPGILGQWETNRLTEDWVELGLYLPWFPRRTDEQFTYRVSATSDQDYEVVGLGRIERDGSGWRVESSAPGNDITILAAPCFHEQARAAAGDVIRVKHSDICDVDLAVHLADDSQWTLDFLTSWLGPRPDDAQQPLIVVAPRVQGGAYVRPGLVIMSRPDGGQYTKGYFRMLAHELAHLWWFRAPTGIWEDWLNEAFAEFSSHVAVREREGEAAFAERLAKTRERAAGLPPIVNLPRNHDQAWNVLYAKGCTILADLEQSIGRDRMTDFLRQAVQRKVNQTADLLQLLADVAGAEAATELDHRLHA